MHQKARYQNSLDNSYIVLGALNIPQLLKHGSTSSYPLQVFALRALSILARTIERQWRRLLLPLFGVQCCFFFCVCLVLLFWGLIGAVRPTLEGDETNTKGFQSQVCGEWKEVLGASAALTWDMMQGGKTLGRVALISGAESSKYNFFINSTTAKNYKILQDRWIEESSAGRVVEPYGEKWVLVNPKKDSFYFA